MVATDRFRIGCQCFVVVAAAFAVRSVVVLVGPVGPVVVVGSVVFVGAAAADVCFPDYL